MKIHDRITFICPYEIIKIRGSETEQGVYIDGLYQNLYVKEVPADITNFDGACDTSGECCACGKIFSKQLIVECRILPTLDHNV